MKLETLKSFNKKKLIIPTIIICSIIIVITLFISHSKYIYKDSITIIDGTVNYKPYDFKIVEMYIEKDNKYEEIETMPELGYIINQELSYCYVDDENTKIKEKVYTNEDGEHIIKELPKRSKCIIYFDSKSKATYNQLLALNQELKSKGNSAHFDGTSCIDDTCTYQENGIYEALDDDGTSYYFRGNIENNYVKFGKIGTTNDGADIWWRIIRINGDGSIRMIYAGTSSDGNVPDQNSETTKVKHIKFNLSKDDNKYVGFEYADGIRNGTTKHYTTDVVKNTEGHKSTILEELEKWFGENLKDEFDDGYIENNAGFCGDRQGYIGGTENTLANETHGINDKVTFYGEFIRTYETHKPLFKCTDKDNDLYTYEYAKQGTKTLKYPIGLITADEVTYAGGLIGTSNLNYYLYNNQYYWTMSPYNFDGSDAHVFVVAGNGILTNTTVDDTCGLRPVINLKPGALTSGNGTPSSPFAIS